MREEKKELIKVRIVRGVYDRMFFDSRPSLSVVVGLGLCVFVGIMNARWWRYREPGARASLTGSQVLLGLLNLLCSLACVYCVSWLGTGTGTGNWLTVVVGVLWVRGCTENKNSLPCACSYAN